MEEFKLPTGEEIPVYKPFSLYDAIEHFMAPLHDFRDLLNAVDIEEADPASIVNVFETLLRDERRLIYSRLAAIEEKLGGRVKSICAARNQNVVPHDTVLEARIVPADSAKEADHGKDDPA